MAIIRIRFLLTGLLLVCFFLSGIFAQDFSIKTAYRLHSPDLEAAQNLYDQGINFTIKNQQDLAAKMFQNAFKAYDDIAERALNNGNFETYVYSLERRANVERRIYDSEKALATLQLAKETAKNNLGYNHFLLSKIYTTSGVIFHRDNQYYEARSFLDSAQILYQKASTYDSSLYSTIIDYKYYAYQYAQGSQDTLLKYLDVRYSLEENKKNPSANELLYILQDYPNVFLQKGDYEQALAYAIRSFKFMEENANTLTFEEQRETLYSLAIVLNQKQQYEEALKIVDKALKLNNGVLIRKQQLKWFNLEGNIYLNLGRYSKALESFIRLDGFRSLTLQEEVFRASIWLSIGKCYIGLNRIEEGESFIYKALNHAKKYLAPPSQDMVLEYMTVGDFEMLQNNPERALYMYDSALRNGVNQYKSDVLSLPSRMDEEVSISDLGTLQKKSLALERMSLRLNAPDSLTTAGLSYVNQTHKELVKNRNKLVATEGKLFLSEKFKRLYESGISICYQLFEKTKDPIYAKRALRFVQLSKANLLLEQSEEYAEVSQNDIPQDLKQQFYETKKLLEDLEFSFYQSLDNSATSDSIIQLNEALAEAKDNLSLIKDTIATYTLSDYRLNEIKSLPSVIPPEATALIDYFYGEDFIYAYMQYKEKEQLFRIGSVNEIQMQVSDLLDAVKQPPQLAKIDSEFDHFKRNAFALYENLLKPLIEACTSKPEALLIVPDDLLSRLPFEILVQANDDKAFNFKDLSYLIKDYRIRYLITSKPSESQNTTAQKTENKKLFGIGFSGKNDLSNQSEYGNLPGTENEIRFLQNSYDGLFLYGNDGSKDRFLKEAQNFDILHLAVHGRTDEDNKYQSTLIFNGKDNLLKTSELYLASLNARLAVLSACESGIGAISSGEGTFSIARGFSIVGVPSVAVSLWKVNDAITSTLMVNLYEKFIDKGMSFNTSLYQTKLDYLASSDSYASHPFYWAAFVHMGEDLHYNPEQNTLRHWGWVFIPFFFLIGGGFVYYRRYEKKKKGC